MEQERIGLPKGARRVSDRDVANQIASGFALKDYRRESEGLIVPFEDEEQQKPVRGKEPCFVRATEEWKMWGLQKC